MKIKHDTILAALKNFFARWQKGAYVNWELGMGNWELFFLTTNS